MSMFQTAPTTQSALPAGVGARADLFDADDCYVVTPSDAADLQTINATLGTRAIRVTGAGNVAVNLAGGGGTAVLTGLVAGQTVFVSVLRVLATGTTATGIFALY